MSIEETVAAVLLVWLGVTLVQGAANCFRAQIVDLDGQLLGLALSAAGFVAYTVLLGVEVKPPAIGAVLVAGVAAGYFVTTMSGFEDVAGFTVARGSGWFLLTWGIASAGAIAGAVADSPALLAVSLLGAAASTGAALGQFASSWQAVRRIEWQRPRPEPAGEQV
jgi:hypothetical protein